MTDKALPGLMELLEATDALQRGHFCLSSGRHSADYVQCARLLESPKRGREIGSALAELFGDTDFDSVAAPALGGLLIGYEVASALELPFRFTERKNRVMGLRRGFSFDIGEGVLLIEDVVTTGKSTRETIEIVEAGGAEVRAVGSIIDRTASRDVFDVPFRSLIELALETFDPEDCPLCRTQEPLRSPGSRSS